MILDLKYHIVCPFVELAPPTPSTLSLSLFGTKDGEGNTRLRVRGWGGTNSDIRTTGDKAWHSVDRSVFVYV
jgi:hypothetical protein